MRKTIAALCAALVATLCCQLASAQCRADSDCAGNMICDNGTCVVPPVSAGSVAPAPLPAVSASTTAAPAPAPAATPAGDSRVRLDLNIALLGFTYSKVDKDPDEGTQDFIFNFGPVPETHLGFGVGYAFGGPISIGVRVFLGFSADRRKDAADESDDTKETWFNFKYSVLPYFEYAFGAGKVRPFITVIAGLDGAMDRLKVDYSGPGPDRTNRYSAATSMGVIGFGGGAHVFLADRVSLDIWLVEAIGIGAVDETDKEEVDGDTNSEDDKTFVWGSRTELFLGITGWI